MHKVRVGPAGWSYADWEGTVYPEHGSRFDHLAYLSSFFDTIEINSPFYRIPPHTHARSWVKRVSANPEFRFTTKVYRGFTHDPGDLMSAEVDAFRRYLDPLMECGRLGAVLLQFPWSFKHSPASVARLTRLFTAFAGYPKALEVRHASFQTNEFLALLDTHDVGWVNVDQPLFHDSVEPAATTTGPVAYARFHGRNYQKWFTHEESWERYDYLYSPEELEPWIDRIHVMARDRDTYVVTNNHFRGQAIVNAGEIKRSLGQSGEVPPALAAVYPGRAGERTG
ncbi:MAG: DUF72 domain-containing protein [Thermoanaerobaculia bacterium]